MLGSRDGSMLPPSRSALAVAAGSIADTSERATGTSSEGCEEGGRCEARQ
jgi:hypothetical protein